MRSDRALKRNSPRPPFILITAGPTREFLDPVRYISNASSGKMGCALAKAFAKRGARVMVISGPIEIRFPEKIQIIPVVSAREMHRAVFKNLTKADIFISAAAVSDWRAQSISMRKIGKRGEKKMLLRLTPNPDILRDVGKWKRNKVRPLLVGFALETHGTRQKMELKMKEKNVDLIIGNSPETIRSERISPLLKFRGEKIKSLGSMTKTKFADKLASMILAGSKK